MNGLDTKAKPCGLLTIVPTRNRVENALGLLDVFYNMSTEDSSGLLFVVGWEDPRFHEYQKKIPSEHLLTFPARGLVKALNYVVSCGYAEEYEALGFMGDDHRPRTRGWDSAYLRNLQQLGYGYVYGNDLLMGERIPTQVAISSSIIRTLGFFGPPGFTHLNVDVTWKDMGEAIGKLRYLDDVVVEHMHPAAGKANEDAGYKHVNSKAMVRLDEQEYVRWKRDDFPKQVALVQRTLGVLE
jgi:hypothetical protein